MIEVLDQRPEGVAVGCNEDALSGLHVLLDDLLKVGHHAGNGRLQGLRRRKKRRVHIPVHRRKLCIPFIVRFQCRRQHVKGPAPDLHLFLSVLCRGLGFVESLQGAVVPLIELPGLVHRKPAPVHLIQDVA